MKSGLRFIGAAFFLVFAAFLVMAAPLYWRQYRILKTWPGADAEVVRSEVTAHATASGPLYATDLTLAYAVAGHPYVGDYEFPHLSTHRDRKQKQAARYPPGSRHWIRYNPADPTDIRIHVGYNVDYFVVPVFVTGLGAIFALIGALFLFASTRVDGRGWRLPALAKLRQAGKKD